MTAREVSLNIAQTDPDRLESSALTSRNYRALRQAPATRQATCHNVSQYQLLL